MRALGLRFEDRDGKRLDLSNIAGWEYVEVEWTEKVSGSKQFYTLTKEEASMLVLTLTSSFLKAVRR